LKLPGARPKANAAFRQGVLRERLTGQSVGLEMAPQGLEKIESAPSGMAPKAPDPQDLVQGAADALASPPDRPK
jgi:hypothetical protein